MASCVVCGGDETEDGLLYCEECREETHYSCAGVKRAVLCDWYCAACRETRRRHRRLRSVRRAIDFDTCANEQMLVERRTFLCDERDLGKEEKKGDLPMPGVRKRRICTGRSFNVEDRSFGRRVPVKDAP